MRRMKREGARTFGGSAHIVKKEAWGAWLYGDRPENRQFAESGTGLDSK